MNKKKSLSGIYAITDPTLMGKEIIAKAEQAIVGGINILQYRNKTAPAAQQKDEAHALRQLCNKHDVLFIVNDDIALAVEVNADGVHIGQQDTDIAEARRQLGAEKIIGVTCNNKIENAIRAQQHGADYVAFGRFFKSATKPSAPPAELTLLENLRDNITIPVVAIGGITHNNAKQLLSHDIDMLAVIESIFGQDDIADAAHRFVEIFQHRDDPSTPSAL